MRGWHALSRDSVGADPDMRTWVQATYLRGDPKKQNVRN